MVAARRGQRQRRPYRSSSDNEGGGGGGDAVRRVSGAADDLDFAALLHVHARDLAHHCHRLLCLLHIQHHGHQMFQVILLPLPNPDSMTWHLRAGIVVNLVGTGSREWLNSILILKACTVWVIPSVVVFWFLSEGPVTNWDIICSVSPTADGTNFINLGKHMYCD